MKKIILMLITLILLTGCFKKEENKAYTKYQKLISELQKIKSSSENIPLNIEINVTEYENNILSYTALINKNDTEMNDIEALLIHNIETENEFPSIGIFDEKISLNKKDKEKGIKLTGYVEKNDKIDFKLLIKYKDNKGKTQKYYYTYNYRQ